MSTFVSVIVITKNNVETLENCIVSLLSQTYPKESYEIIFVDGHSTDGTDEMVKKYAKNHSLLRLYYEDHGTMGYARNLGVSKSKGSIICFTDGDAVVPKEWIERITNAFKNDVQLAAIGGLEILVSSSESGRIIESWRRLKSVTGIKAVACIRTVNFAIRRHALLSCGGFDPKLSHRDEAELLARLYSKAKTTNILYDPEIVVHHKRPPSRKISSRIRKVFEKSLVGTSVLMRRYVMKVAVANPSSSLGTSFLLILACIAGTPLFLFSIATGLVTNILVIALLLYVIILVVYMVAVFLRARKANLVIPLILTSHFVIRLAGTFFGLIKWFLDFVTQKIGRARARAVT